VLGNNSRESIPQLSKLEILVLTEPFKEVVESRIAMVSKLTLRTAKILVS